MTQVHVVFCVEADFGQGLGEYLRAADVAAVCCVGGKGCGFVFRETLCVYLVRDLAPFQVLVLPERLDEAVFGVFGSGEGEWGVGVGGRRDARGDVGRDFALHSAGAG